MKGELNSSITRVRPVFQALLARDKIGTQWLEQILDLAGKNKEYAALLADNPGRIDPTLLRKRNYIDPVMFDFGIKSIMLEECFEKCLPPPEPFLRWLIKNPYRMRWPKADLSMIELESLRLRERLFGQHGEQAQDETIARALRNLDESGAAGSKGKWWAFEGFTNFDFYIETETLILVVEGKRKEDIASSTRWFKGRNQIVRNLEVTREASGGKEYAVMLISESTIDPVTAEDFENGLPHFKPEEREELYRHYLGNFEWRDLCKATGISYQNLPVSTSEVAESLK